MSVSPAGARQPGTLFHPLGCRGGLLGSRRKIPPAKEALRPAGEGEEGAGPGGDPAQATPARPMPAGNCPPTPWGPIPPPLTGTGAPGRATRRCHFGQFPPQPPHPGLASSPGRHPSGSDGWNPNSPTPPLRVLTLCQLWDVPSHPSCLPWVCSAQLHSGQALQWPGPACTEAPLHPFRPLPPSPRTRSCRPPPVSNRLQTASGHPRRCVLSWLLGVVQLLSSPAPVEIAGEFSLPPPSSFKVGETLWSRSPPFLCVCVHLSDLS